MVSDYDKGIEAAAKAVYSQYYGPSMGESRPKTREVQIAMAAVEAFLSVQPTAYIGDTNVDEVDDLVWEQHASVIDVSKMWPCRIVEKRRVDGV